MIALPLPGWGDSRNETRGGLAGRAGRRRDVDVVASVRSAARLRWNDRNTLGRLLGRRALKPLGCGGTNA